MELALPVTYNVHLYPCHLYAVFLHLALKFLEFRSGFNLCSLPFPSCPTSLCTPVTFAAVFRYLASTFLEFLAFIVSTVDDNFCSLPFSSHKTSICTFVSFAAVFRHLASQFPALSVSTLAPANLQHTSKCPFFSHLLQCFPNAGQVFCLTIWFGFKPWPCLLQ